MRLSLTDRRSSHKVGLQGYNPGNRLEECCDWKEWCAAMMRVCSRSIPEISPPTSCTGDGSLHTDFETVVSKRRATRSFKWYTFSYNNPDTEASISRKERSDTVLGNDLEEDKERGRGYSWAAGTSTTIRTSWATCRLHIRTWKFPLSPVNASLPAWNQVYGALFVYCSWNFQVHGLGGGSRKTWSGTVNSDSPV